MVGLALIGLLNSSTSQSITLGVSLSVALVIYGSILGARLRHLIKTERLDITASTSGIVEAEINVEMLDLSATTSGQIDLSGNAKEIEASASTGGEIDAFDVDTDDVYAKASTGAAVRVTANERLKGSANTGGDVRYRGNARTDIRTSTGGSVRKS